MAGAAAIVILSALPLNVPDQVFAPEACHYSVSFPDIAQRQKNETAHAEVAELVLKDLRLSASCTDYSTEDYSPPADDVSLKLRLIGMGAALGVKNLSVSLPPELPLHCGTVDGTLAQSGDDYLLRARFCFDKTSLFIAEAIVPAGDESPPANLFLNSLSAR